MYRTFTATRISEGNMLFPPTITLDDTGVTIKSPALLSSRRNFVPYHAISNVEIYNPLVGFSSISISAYGKTVTVNGFYSAEVEEMKRIIENGGDDGYGW